MTSEAAWIGPEDKDFIDAIEYLMDPGDKGKLQRLLRDESWQRFVAAANLSRDEADALYADLSQLEALMAMEDKDMPSADHVHGESFMKEFPQVKRDLEERIRKHYAFADEVDKVHRDCTTSKVAAAFTGAVSELLTIAGLLLEPVTILDLFATYVRAGIAAGMTSVTAKIVYVSKDASAKAEANSLVITGSDTEKVLKEVLSRSTPEIASFAQKCFQSLQGVVKNARAFKQAKSNPLLAAKAARLIMRSGAVSARSSKQLHEAFGGTALAMSKGARVLGAASAGVSLIKHLHEGGKAESAEELRQQAQEGERRLEELTRTHKSLQEATNKQGEFQELIGYFLFLLFCFFLYIYFFY